MPFDIAMKSKGCFDRNSLTSINSARVQGSFSSSTLSAQNRSAAQKIPALNTPVSSIHMQTNARTPSAARSMPPVSGRNKPSASIHNAPSASVSAPPPRQKLPAFGNPVQKGRKLPLTADGKASGIWKACFGWNTSNPQCDADVSAFLLGADGKVLGDSWFVFYGQTESPDKSCRLQNGQGTDREVITLDFQKLHTNVKKIVFVLTIHEAFSRRLHFGMMQDAYIRIFNDRNAECVSFQMREYYSNVISMMIGEIYQYNGSWKFHAVGNGVAKDLAGLCALYGVEVSD